MPPTMVLDVGKIKGRDWAVIEPNPVSSSGIYACDAEKVLLALKRACVKQEIAVGSDDSQWIVNRPI